MTYTTEFVDNGRGVLHAGLGVVTGAEIIDGATCALQAVQDGMPLRYALVDFTASTQLSVNTDEVRAIARINIAVAGINSDICVAIVAPSDHVFGMARMWEVHVDTTAWPTHVFRDAGDARAWLAECVGDAALIAAIDGEPRTDDRQE